MQPSTRGDVLVADDDAAMRQLVCRLLSAHGFACQAVTTGAEVRDALQRQAFDLLISDVDMPGNRNLETIADVPILQPQLPVILMTGVPSVDSAVRSVRLSVAAYLVKPFQPEELVEAASKAVDRRRFFANLTRNRERLTQLCTQLHHLETAADTAGTGGVQASAKAYLHLAFQNAAESLLEFRRVLELLQQSPENAGSAQDPTHPLALLQALRETVEVLERTKVSFKSRELGDLRRKIESLLQT